MNYKYGWQRRRRLLLDGSETDLCGQTENYKPCLDPLCFTLVKEQGECVPANGNCGLGIRNNKWKCKSNNGQIVEKTLCQEIQLPTERCRLKCPGECVMSDWTEWTPCKTLCNNSDNNDTLQTRIKFVKAQASNGFQQCTNSTFTETRECSAKRK